MRKSQDQKQFDSDSVIAFSRLIGAIGALLETGLQRLRCLTSRGGGLALFDHRLRQLGGALPTMHLAWSNPPSATSSPGQAYKTCRWLWRLPVTSELDLAPRFRPLLCSERVYKRSAHDDQGDARSGSHSEVVSGQRAQPRPGRKVHC
jgi:hypothetical protein